MMDEDYWYFDAESDYLYWIEFTPHAGKTTRAGSLLGNVRAGLHYPHSPAFTLDSLIERTPGSPLVSQNRRGLLSPSPLSQIMFSTPPSRGLGKR